MKLQDLIKKDENNKFICLENNKKYKSVTALTNLLISKYNLSLLDYCIKWNLVDQNNYVKCKICDKYTDRIQAHLHRDHKDITINNYKIKFGTKELVGKGYSEHFKNIVSGENNGNHKSKVSELKLKQQSPFSVEYWKKKYPTKNDSEIDTLMKEFFDSALSDREFTTRLEYYTDRGFDIDEAKKLLKERQTTFSLQKCIERYGEDEGLTVFNRRQYKWHESLVKNGNLKLGYSEVSQELFEIISEAFISDKLFYAKCNNEYFISKKKQNAEQSFFAYDFTNLTKRKIIEFNGDSYHGNPSKYKATDYPHPFRKHITAQELWDKDRTKYNIAKEEGFDIITIWESEYRKDKEGTIKKCVDFLQS